MSIIKQSLIQINENNYLSKGLGLIDALNLKFKEVQEDSTDLHIFEIINISYDISGIDFDDPKKFELNCELFYELLHKHMRTDLVFVFKDDYDKDQEENYFLYNLFRSTNFGFILSLYFLLNNFDSKGVHKDFVKYLNDILIDSFDSLYVKIKSTLF